MNGPKADFCDRLGRINTACPLLVQFLSETVAAEAFRDGRFGWRLDLGLLCHPSSLLKIYIYGYLNRIQSRRRLEREAQRNLELMWLTGRLMPDFKTIANFRKDNGASIRRVCREFIALCRRLDLFSEAIVAIDGSKFKAVNNRDRNFTVNKMKRRLEQIEESVTKYPAQLDAADRQETAGGRIKAERLEGKIQKLREEVRRRKKIEARMLETPEQQISLTDPDARSMATSGKGMGVVGYNVQTAVDAKAWMGATHFLTKTLPKVKAEMSLHVLAYNLKRMMKILTPEGLIDVMQT
jgi:hypothetical protein